MLSNPSSTPSFQPAVDSHFAPAGGHEPSHADYPYHASPKRHRDNAEKHATWFKDLLATLTAASGIGYAATAYTVSRWLTRSSRSIPRSPIWEDDLHCEEMECITRDGFKLQGWVVTPQKPRATMALFHGLRGDRSRTLSRMDFLLDAGYRCVAIDHRAHGLSLGNVTSFGYYERLDTIAVLDMINERWPDQPRAALGISMGAAALCYGAEETRTFDALILESMYRHLETAFHSRVGSHFPQWFQRFSPGVIWLTEKRLGLQIKQLAPIDFIGALSPTPVMLVTGEHDPYATPEEMDDLYAQLQGPRQLEVIRDADHDSVLITGGAYYRNRIIGFLEKHLYQQTPLRRAA